MTNIAKHTSENATLPTGFAVHDDPVFGELTYCTPRPELRKEGEVLYLKQSYELQPHPNSVIEYMCTAARNFPDRIVFAERGANGWDGPTYAQFKQDCKSVAQALLDRGMKQGDCVAIISRNSIPHAQIMFGAMMAGIAVAPISPNYALFPEAFSRLESTFAQTKARMFFVDDAVKISGALEKLDLADCEVVSENPRPGDTAMADLLSVKPTNAVADAYSGVGPNTVAKILFTSGSTGTPKGVINTHRMLSANMASTQQVSMLVPFAHRRNLCWLPWHHTFGGNYVVNDTLRAAATLYIDSGRPVDGPDFERSLQAIREVRPTTIANVPLAYTMLVEAMEKDDALAEDFFSGLTFLRYGGAGFPIETYERIQKLAVIHRGHRIPLVGGFAMTETSPSSMTVHWPYDGVGRLGLPLPGVEVKLLPLDDDRYELRVRGPHVFPGYVDQPELNEQSFDEEGFFRTGDAISLVDPDDLKNSLKYAGRVSEDFKLDSGTFVQVNAIRLGFLQECAGLCREAVVAGEGRSHVSLLVWLSADARARATTEDGDLIRPAPEDLEVLRTALDRWNAANSGSSRRIRSVGVLAEAPSMSDGEINDKGYVNQRRVLKTRAETVARLYDDGAGGIGIRTP